MREKNNNQKNMPNQKPSAPKNKKKASSGVSKKEEKVFLDSNKIEDNIVNETPVVYDTPQCSFPTRNILADKPMKKLSLWERFINFIVNL